MVERIGFQGLAREENRMDLNQMKKILEDKNMVSPIEDCTQLGMIINLIKIKQKKTVIYGAGLMGGLTIKYLRKYKVDVEYAIDADVEKTGNYIENIKIIGLDAAAELGISGDSYISFIALDRNNYDKYHIDIESFLDGLGIQHFYFENIWVRTFRSYYVQQPVQYAEDFLRVYDFLADSESKETLMEFIRCSLKNDSWLLPEHMCIDKYWGCDFEGKDVLYRHLDDEIWLNCGSFMGDTIFNYLGKGYHFKKIYAVEGNDDSFGQLCKNIQLLEEIKENIELINMYIGNAEGQLCMDDFFRNREVTLINADIEGAEMDVLRAAKDVIIAQKPVIAFCVYHHFQDTIDFIKYLQTIQPDYHFYLRKYVSGVYNRFMNEVVLYAIPTNRLMQK